MNGRSVVMKAAVLLGLVALLSSCATTAPTERQVPGVDVTGTWSGTWYGGGTAGDLTMSLKQVGADVTGMVAVPGWTAFSGALAGTVERDIFRYTTAAVMAGGAELTVTGDQMSGLNRAGNRLVLRRQR